MNEITKQQENNLLPPKQQIIDAHKFLLDFLEKFKNSKRGGIHDFMEIALFNMVNSAIKNIDTYLKEGYHDVNATQIMFIFVDACQKTLDGIKRNLDGMPPVYFKR